MQLDSQYQDKQGFKLNVKPVRQSPQSDNYNKVHSYPKVALNPQLSQQYQQQPILNQQSQSQETAEFAYQLQNNSQQLQSSVYPQPIVQQSLPIQHSITHQIPLQQSLQQNPILVQQSSPLNVYSPLQQEQLRPGQQQILYSQQHRQNELAQLNLQSTQQEAENNQRGRSLTNNQYFKEHGKNRKNSLRKKTISPPQPQQSQIIQKITPTQQQQLQLQQQQQQLIQNDQKKEKPIKQSKQYTTGQSFGSPLKMEELELESRQSKQQEKEMTLQDEVIQKQFSQMNLVNKNDNIPPSQITPPVILQQPNYFSLKQQNQQPLINQQPTSIQQVQTQPIQYIQQQQPQLQYIQPQPTIIQQQPTVIPQQQTQAQSQFQQIQQRYQSSPLKQEKLQPSIQQQQQPHQQSHLIQQQQQQQPIIQQLQQQQLQQSFQQQQQQAQFEQSTQNFQPPNISDEIYQGPPIPQNYIRVSSNPPKQQDYYLPQAYLSSQFQTSAQQQQNQHQQRLNQSDFQKSQILYRNPTLQNNPELEKGWQQNSSFVTANPVTSSQPQNRYQGFSSMDTLQSQVWTSKFQRSFSPQQSRVQQLTDIDDGVLKMRKIGKKPEYFVIFAKLFKDILCFEQQIQQVKKALNRQNDVSIQKIWQFFDENMSGEVILSEFQSTIQKFDLKPEVRDLQLVFYRITNGKSNKQISFENFKLFFKPLGEEIQENRAFGDDISLTTKNLLKELFRAFLNEESALESFKQNLLKNYKEDIRVNPQNYPKEAIAQPENQRTDIQDTYKEITRRQDLQGVITLQLLKSFLRENGSYASREDLILLFQRLSPYRNDSRIQSIDFNGLWKELNPLLQN